MAERLQEDPWRLNRASYEVARQPGLEAARYRRALGQAEAARALAHPGFYFSPYHAATQVGIARYRLGEYRQAVEALTASEADYAAVSPQFKAGAPWNLAFLAMAHHQLGEKENAGAILARLHNTLMKDSRWASRDDLRTYLREAEELCVWGGPPLTDEEQRLRREAADLVNGLPADLGFKDEILDYLRTLPALGEPLRQHALTMAERLPEDPWRLNHASFFAQRAGLDAARYRLALRHAEAARDLAHPGFVFAPNYPPTTHIGIAHYRLGEYREAVEALTTSEAYYAAADARYKAGTPWNIAFLAMAHQQLGEEEKAQAILARLRGVMKDPAWASRDDLRTYVREAQQLIEGRAPDPQK
jgi:hypothetical protein